MMKMSSNIASNESTAESDVEKSDSYSVDRSNVEIGSEDINDDISYFNESFAPYVSCGNHVHSKIPSKKERSTFSTDEMKLKNPKTCNKLIIAVSKCYNHVGKESASEISTNQIIFDVS